MQKYLQAYRINHESTNKLHPFTEESVAKIAELSDYNASKIIKMAYELLETAIDNKIELINLDLVLATYNSNGVAK